MCSSISSLRRKRFRRAFEHPKLGRAQESATSPPTPSFHLLRSPQFSRRQKVKNASNGRKNLRKRLLRRLFYFLSTVCQLATQKIPCLLTFVLMFTHTDFDFSKILQIYFSLQCEVVTVFFVRSLFLHC